MRKTIIITALISGFIGFLAGNAFWYLASPLWIDNIVQEERPTSTTLSAFKEGQFRDIDATHKGSGKAVILKNTDGSNILRLSDFTVTNGPNLVVYLVEGKNVKTSDDVTSSKWVSLGRLKGNVGDQNYFIPSEAGLDKYNSVVIWCEQFGVLFSSADLRLNRV